jgi:choline dehydrogenase-like flavoprotein
MLDVIVVGSGASAVHAAWPLAAAGRRVLMLDVGARDTRYADLLPRKGFSAIRGEEPEQARYFLGDDFEGIPAGPVRVGAQLTPPRKHIAALAEALQPLAAGDFNAMQSLALGGLAAGWGAGAFPFNDRDLAQWPITREALQPHYEAVARQIGVCGRAHGDLGAELGPLAALLPAARTDSNGLALFARYRKQRAALRARGFALDAPWLAVATREVGGRGPMQYLDMEFWGDADRAVYRPAWTLEQLRAFPNFEYREATLVEHFAEPQAGRIEVHARHAQSGEALRFECARLVLAAGALGTARIVLASFGMFGERLPLVSNPYTYFPCLNLGMLGRTPRDARHSLTQAMAMFTPRGERDAQGNAAAPLMAQAYSYRSLLAFKLIKEMPLPMPQARQLAQLMQPALVIVGVHHADGPAAGKALWLEPGVNGAPATLRIEYRPTNEEQEQRRRRERELMRCFRALGCVALRRIDPGHGASIHYGGPLPMQREARALTTELSGRLRGTQGVYVADGAAFPDLPAKGLTLTLMANARRVGAGLA